MRSDIKEKVVEVSEAFKIEKKKMATIKLTCPAGGPCNYVTEEVDAQTALALLTMHERTTHPTADGGEERTKVMKPGVYILP